MSTSPQLVAKLWSYCNVLRDDGLSYGDYVEQLTFLLFLKMADEGTRPPYGRPSSVPEGYDWPSLLARSGDDLETHYRHVLEGLGSRGGLLGLIFRKAQNKVQDPAKLERLIKDLIDRESWLSMSADVKGDAYEGLLQRNAEDVKGGAGQYFTPRPLIQAIVRCVDPQPGETVCDPACGTGGFLLGAYEHVLHDFDLDRDQLRALRSGALHGVELVDSVARLCAMNLLLHGIGVGTPTLPSPKGEGSEKMAASPPNPPLQDEPLGEGGLPITTRDALAGKHGTYRVVLSNPPFGKKSSVTIVGEDGETGREGLTLARDDFWATTSNKQLNFLQHIFTILEQHGRAAVVVPDNVLFEGGAGETIRRRLLAQCDVHTLLRLPTGIFYAQGVKANVIFFDRKPAAERPWTQRLWIYDLRTNRRFTLKENPLKYEDLRDFEIRYNSDNRHDREETERFRSFGYDELVRRDKANLDLFWLKDDSLEDSANLPAPEVLAAEIVEDLEAALAQFSLIAGDLAAKR